MAEQPEKMTDEALVSLVDTEFDHALGVPGGDIAEQRALAFDYYMSKLIGNEVEGRSKVVTADVAEIVDSIMPSLLRIFTVAHNVVSFDPVGDEDEKGAEQESDDVSYVFFKKNPAFTILFFWFFDALVQKNGVVKAWWDDSEKVTKETYKGLSNEELGQILQDDDDELEIVELEERTDTIVQDVPTAIGAIPMPIEGIVNDVVIERKTKRGQTRVAAVAPEECRISSDSNSPDPSEARMVGQECDKTRSELIEMGFSKKLVYELPVVNTAQESPESKARKDKSDERLETSLDRSQQKVRIREAYIRVDFDGDGRSELRQVITAVGGVGNKTADGKASGSRLLSNEEVDRQPFHVITPHPIPHKHFGRATAEKVMDIQTVMTTLLRQQLDNLYHTNNPGHAVWESGIGDNTLDDLLTTRVGRVARFRRPPNESYAPMTVPFTAAASFPMLEHFDKLKRDRTGVSSDGQGLSPDALKNVQISVLANQMDLSRMKIEAIARVFAETGIRSLFLHIHELELKHQNKARRVKLRNEWVNVDPTAWRTRYDMTVNIGLGIGSREQSILHLEQIWQKQAEMAQNGGMNLTVTPRNLYNTAAEMVKATLMQEPGRYFTDPGDKTAPPPSDEQQQLQQLQAQLTQRQQQLDAREQQLDMLELQARHQRDMQDLQIKQQKVNNDFTIALEDIATKLTAIELNSGQNVPGAKV